jgi:hypothetical protein
MGRTRDLAVRDPAVRRARSPEEAPAVEAGAATPDARSAESILALQRRAGNAAVARLVEDAPGRTRQRRPVAKTVQRDPQPKRMAWTTRRPAA